MIKIAIISLVLVSTLSSTAAPTWTRDLQIDSGELKVVNFETYLAGKTTAFVAPNQTVVGFLHYNYTSFSSTPRVIVSMKSYGVFPSTTFTSLSMGYRFSIVSRNATNLTYSVTAIGVTLMALHYQYFAVVGYTNLYHMQFYTIPLNTTYKVYDIGQPFPRVDYITLTNPENFVTNSNYGSSEMILQVWPYSFLYTPTTSTLSFNTSAVPISPTMFNLTISADSGCSLQELGISVLFLNTTQIYQSTYSIFVDTTTYYLTGSDTANAQSTSTMDNTTLQYQFRNSEEGIKGIYLPFSGIMAATVFYFTATSSNVSQLYYFSVQSRVRVCSGANPVFSTEDKLCHDSCPTYYYTLNTTYGYCKQCHYSCLKCSSADISTACTQCNATQARVLSNSSCLCNLTYFDNGTELCVACYYTCLTCTSTLSTSCLSCDSGLHRTISNSTCTCSYGYYENYTCFACLNSCIQCSYMQSNQSFHCIACNSSLFMKVDTNQQFCTCFSGYYNHSGSCSQCISGCLTCSDGSTCDSCDSANNWIKSANDSICKCADSYYLVTINSTKFCAACDATCFTCSNNLNTSCLSCNSALNREKVNSSCICSIGYYENVTCLSCLHNCSSCIFYQGNQTYQCLSCDNSSFLTLHSNQTTCVCSDGYYNNSGVCSKCMSGCLLCSTEITCDSCDLLQNWEKNTSDSTCNCANHFYQLTANSTTSCSACHSTCLTCSGSLSTSCLNCDSSIHRNMANSTCTCAYGYYDNITCFICINNCIQCSFSQSNQSYQCIACNSLLFQQIDTGTQSCTCFNGYYNHTGLCTRCIDGCLACSNGVTCNSCNSSGNWQQNLPGNTCKCIDNYYLLNSTCLSCPNGCLSCFYSVSIVQCSQCNISSHFVNDNSTCICETGYHLSGTVCLVTSFTPICGNSIIESGEQCDDGNIQNFDGCSSTCEVQTDHICLNNITNTSICYYDKILSFTTEDIFKQPLENRVIVTLLVSAPNCNSTFLKNYLETSLTIVLASSRLLTSSDITNQNVKYDTETGIAKLDFQYNQNIDLTKKQVKFVSSQTFTQSSNKYFYDSPSTSISLTNPNNLLLTTYSSESDIQGYKSMSYAFAALIAFTWLFWLISICYHQTATAVEFMIVAQIAFESLLQRKFITDGWVGLVLYGKYWYGYNISYQSQVIYDRLRILSLNTYLFHTLNISTVLLVIVVAVILGIFCYETVTVAREDNNLQLNSTQAKIDMKANHKSEERKEEEQRSYKIKKGIALALFEVGTSFAFLTVKIVVINLMMVTVKVIIDVVIVVSLMSVCYFLMWYFYYRCFDYDFLDDFSFKRMLRDEQSRRHKSYCSKVGNIFTKYFYFIIFLLLAGFGVVDGSPSFGAPFYILGIIVSIIMILMMIIYGVYFRMMHLVRSICNILALVGIMVLHLLQSLNIDHPSQSMTGPIICVSLLYLSFFLNFGIMGLIEYRRHRSKSMKYSNAKIAPDPINIVQFNETEEPELPKDQKLQIELVDPRQPISELRRSNHSNGSLAQESKFQSLKSKSKENSIASTHKKRGFQRQELDQNEETNQKKESQAENIDSILIPEYVVIRQKVEKQESNQNENFDETSQVQRIEILDMSRSYSDFSKTKTKIKNPNPNPKPQQSIITNKKTIDFVDIQS